MNDEQATGQERERHLREPGRESWSEYAMRLKALLREVEAERDGLRKIADAKPGRPMARLNGIWRAMHKREPVWAERVNYFGGSSRAVETEFFRAFDLMTTDLETLRGLVAEMQRKLPVWMQNVHGYRGDWREPWLEREVADWLARAAIHKPKPIPMLLWCPSCHRQHWDEGEWATKPHKTHLCAFCGNEWRPADVATVGVHKLAHTHKGGK